MSTVSAFPKKESQLKEKEDRCAARQAAFKSLAEEAKRLKATDIWKAEEDALV